nr:MAG TPA: hypothetical protein [Bacteriophage sp.]
MDYRKYYYYSIFIDLRVFKNSRPKILLDILLCVKFFICYVIIISIFYFILNISFNTYIIMHI